MKLQNFLSHLCLIGTFMVATLLIVDLFNPTMDFINNSITKAVLAVLCAAAAVLAVSVLTKNRSNRK